MPLIALALAAALCPAIGKPAPAFSIPVANGDSLSLRAELARKRPLVISFFRYDCEPCKKELPALQRLAAEWKGKVSFALIHVGETETRARALLDQLRVTLPWALDRFGLQSEKYCADSLPTLYLIDAKGTVRAVAKGGQGDVQSLLRAQLAKLGTF